MIPVNESGLMRICSRSRVVMTSTDKRVKITNKDDRTN